MAAAPPFDLTDDILILIAAGLDVQTFGRLACTAQRFWRKSEGSAPELWSMVEEGARRRLDAQSEQARGWTPRATGGSWLRALAEVEKLLLPL